MPGSCQGCRSLAPARGAAPTERSAVRGEVAAGQTSPRTVPTPVDGGLRDPPSTEVRAQLRTSGVTEFANPQPLAASPAWLHRKAPRMRGNSASIWFHACWTCAVLE